MIKLFVALNFSNQSVLSRKITGFRKRFDPKYNRYSFAHMAMMAPFETEADQVLNLAETLKEELDTFYYGNNEMPKLGFTGMGVFNHKKKTILYLNPHYGVDLEYCSEIMLDICKDFFPHQYKYKANKTQFLPLGYFQNVMELEPVMEQAKIEFTNFSQIPVASISLYALKNGVWSHIEKLIEFEDNDERFLQLHQPSL